MPILDFGGAKLIDVYAVDAIRTGNKNLSDEQFNRLNNMLGTGMNYEHCLTTFLRALFIEHEEDKLKAFKRPQIIYDRLDGTVSLDISQKVEGIINKYAPEDLASVIILWEPYRVDYDKFVEKANTVVKVGGDASKWMKFDNDSKFKIDKYLTQRIETCCFANTERKTTVIVVNSPPNSEWQHDCIGMLGRLMPYYFPLVDINSEENQKVKAFFKSVSSSNPNARQEIVAYCDRIYEEYDVENLILHLLFDDVKERIAETRIKDLQTLIRDLESQIETWRESLKTAYVQYDESKFTLESYLNSDVEHSDEFYQFFSERRDTLKIVHLGEDVDRNGVTRPNTFALKYDLVVPLLYYDLKGVENAIKRRVGDDSLQKVLKALLIDRRGLCKVSARFKLTNWRQVDGVRDEKAPGTMPACHIYYHNCWGSNKIDKEQAENAGNWQMAVEQSYMAAQNWNIDDGTVSTEFFSFFEDQYREPSEFQIPFIWVKDGSKGLRKPKGCRAVTISEFEKIINEKIAEEENNGTENNAN